MVHSRCIIKDELGCVYGALRRRLGAVSEECKIRITVLCTITF